MTTTEPKSDYDRGYDQVIQDLATHPIAKPEWRFGPLKGAEGVYVDFVKQLSPPPGSDGTFEKGFNAALDAMTAYAKRKFDESGDDAWLGLFVEFFEERAAAHFEHAGELERFNRERSKP